MKYLVFILVCLATAAQAQRVSSKDVPAPATAAFAKAYPDAKWVEWRKDDKFYEVEFEQKTVDYSVTYDIMGKLISTKVEISREELPQAIKDYATSHYAGKRVKHAAKMNMGGSNSYVIVVNGMDVKFDSAGHFISEAKSND